MNIWVGLSSIVVAVATVIYVVLTHKILKAMLESKKPFVDLVLYFESPGLLQMRISNVGNTPAKNVKFTVETDCPLLTLQGSDRIGLKTCPPIKDGISYLPAGASYQYLIGWLDSKVYDPSEQNNTLRISINFHTPGGEPLNSVVHYDLSQFREVELLSLVGEGQRIANALNEIERILARKFPWDPDPVNRLTYVSCPVCSSQIPRSAKKCPLCFEWIDSQNND